MDIKFSCFDINGTGSLDTDEEKLKFSAAIDEQAKIAKSLEIGSTIDWYKELEANIHECLNQARGGESNQDIFPSTAYEFARIWNDKYKNKDGNDYGGIDATELMGEMDTARSFNGAVLAVLNIQDAKDAITETGAAIDIAAKHIKDHGLSTEYTINDTMPAILLNDFDVLQLKVTASDAEKEVYGRIQKVDIDGNKRVSPGQELTNFYKGFSSNKNNNILSSDDMDHFKDVTRFYFMDTHNGKDAADLRKNPRLGTTDQPNFHRFTHRGESLVLGDIVKDYGQ